MTISAQLLQAATHVRERLELTAHSLCIADRPGFSFRGDSRWLGVAKAAGADVLAGLGASGNLVYASVGDAKSEI